MRANDESGHLRGHPLAPRVKGHVLFATALAAALLGLSLLDVAPSQGAHHAGVDDSADCIVAAAIFAGVSAGAPVSLP